MFNKKNKPHKNKKVKNATPLIQDDIEFKSRLEAYCYLRLKECGIEAVYEGKTFTILEPIEYLGEKIRKMTYTPDFIGDEFVIECKGNPNDAFPLRWKIFKHHLNQSDKKYNLYLPRNKKDVDEVIKDIINKRKINER